MPSSHWSRGMRFALVLLGLWIVIGVAVQVAGLAQTGEEARSASAGAVRTWGDVGQAPITSQGVPGSRKVEMPLGRIHIHGKSQAPEVSIQGSLTPKTELDPGAARVNASGVRALAPNVSTSFEGPDNLDNSAQCSYIARPPDPHIAAGSNRIVVVTNVVMAVYSKSGTLLKITCLDDWFANVHDPATDGGLFDPRIAYDPHENRWIMMILAKNGPPTGTEQSWYLVSVSQSSDPTGAWWNWRLNGLLNAPATGSVNAWADYPDLGFDGIPSTSGAGGGIYIGANTFDFSDNFGTNVLNILPKSALYSGSSFSYWMAWGRQNSVGWDASTLRTAQVWDSGSPEFVINTVGALGQVSLWQVTPTFPPNSVSWVLQATLTIGSYSLPPDATQLGCTDVLDTISNRMYNAVVRDNKVYAAFAEGFDFGSGTVAAIRYLKVDATTSAVDLDVRFGADGIHHWFPAIAVDASGNITLVYARSSDSEYASIYYTGRRTTDSTTQAGALLKAGQLCITGFRWGDYFGAAPDPADGGKIWIFGEWAKDLATVDAVWDWGTWIAQVGFGNPNPTAAVFTVSKEGTVSSDRAYFCGLSQNCFNTGLGADLAERIDVSEPVEPGDVVEIDPEHPGRYRKARGPYSDLVAGVISTSPGITLANRPDELRRLPDHLQTFSLLRTTEVRPLLTLKAWGEPRVSVASLLNAKSAVPAKGLIAQLAEQRRLELTIQRVLAKLPGRPLLALMGRVYVKATTENGPIMPGDLLTTATEPGYVMRCDRPEECAGAIVGKALESLPTGEGLIEVLVMR